MTTHALTRTSPKGEAFLGECILCGAKDLPLGAARDECINPAGVSQADAILKVIAPDPPPTDKTP